MDAIKGPWCVIRCDDAASMNMLAISMEERPDYHLGDYDDERQIDPAKIAAIVYHQSRPLVCPEDVDGAEERARLIAAAPDLLSVVSKLFHRLDRNAVIGIASDNDLFVEAREALAKAVGAMP